MRIRLDNTGQQTRPKRPAEYMAEAGMPTNNAKTLREIEIEIEIETKTETPLILQGQQSVDSSHREEWRATRCDGSISNARGNDLSVLDRDWVDAAQLTVAVDVVLAYGRPSHVLRHR